MDSPGALKSALDYDIMNDLSFVIYFIFEIVTDYGVIS